MGEENCVEDPYQKGYRWLEMFQGSVLYTVWARSLADPETPDGFVNLVLRESRTLADSLEAQYHPVNDPSVPAVIEVVTETMRAYSFAPASEPKLTNPHGSSRRHSGSQGRQRTRPRWYSQQGNEASSTRHCVPLSLVI